MAGAMRDEAAAQRRAGQRQVADGVQQLVADEFVGHAQAAGIQHPRLIDHDGIVQAAAPGQPGGPQLLDLLGQGERAGARQFLAEVLRASGAATAPAGRWPRRRNRSTAPYPGNRRRDAPGGSSANASPSLTRTGRRISITGRGASWSTMPAQSDQEHERGGGAVEDRRLRPIDLDQRIVDAAAGQRRHHVLDRADPGCRIAVRPAPWPDACRRHGRTVPGYQHRSRSGGTQCRGPPAPDGASG